MRDNSRSIVQSKVMIYSLKMKTNNVPRNRYSKGTVLPNSKRGRTGDQCKKWENKRKMR